MRRQGVMHSVALAVVCHELLTSLSSDASLSVSICQMGCSKRVPRVAEALRPLRPSDRRSKAIKCSVIIVAAGDERERNEWASATQGKAANRRINGDQRDTGDDVARAKIINYTHTRTSTTNTCDYKSLDSRGG